MNKILLFEMFPYLDTDGLILKKVENEDANDLYEILTNETLFQFRPDKPLKRMNAVDTVIRNYERDFIKQKSVSLGIYYKTEGNKLVGIAEMFHFDDKTNSVEIGYILNENYWGRGIATNAMAMILDFLFEAINVNRIQSSPMTINIKSKNVLRRNNFAYEGTLRQFKYWTNIGTVDLDMFSILKRDYKESI